MLCFLYNVQNTEVIVDIVPEIYLKIQSEKLAKSWVFSPTLLLPFVPFL